MSESIPLKQESPLGHVPGVLVAFVLLVLMLVSYSLSSDYFHHKYHPEPYQAATIGPMYEGDTIGPMSDESDGGLR